MKKNKIHDSLLIIGMIYYVIEVFFLHWLCLDDSIKFCSIIIFCLVIVVKLKENLRIDSKYIIMLYIYCLYLVMNLIFAKDHSSFFSKIVYYTITPISIYSFLLIFSKNKNVMRLYGEKIIPNFLNIYFLINIPILAMQCKGTGFLMIKLDNDYFNHFYPDHISGLLGLDGTHKFAILTIAVIYSNIYMGMKSKKKIYYIYTIVEIAFSLWISTFNDNKAYFILLPLMSIPLITWNYTELKKKSARILLIMLSLCLVFLCIYISSSIIQEVLNEKIFYLFDQNSEHNLSEQERTYVIKYALENGKLFGNRNWLCISKVRT